MKLNNNSILRSADASDMPFGGMPVVGGESTTPSASTPSGSDPFDEAAGGVDTSFPVLMPDRTCRFRVKSATKEHNAEKNSDSIKIKVVLEEDATFRDGKPARKGFPVTTWIGITPSENYDVDSIKRGCAPWIKACLGHAKAATTTVRAFMDSPSMIEECILDCLVGIKKDKTGQYPDNNTVRPVIPA